MNGNYEKNSATEVLVLKRQTKNGQSINSRKQPNLNSIFGVTIILFFNKNYKEHRIMKKLLLFNLFATIIFLANAASPINISISSTNEYCNGGANATISPAISGGATPYTYLWSNGATTKNLISIPVGTYTITVTDANQATATASANISEPTAISIATSTTPGTCAGSPTGSVSITVAGGTPSYNYKWSNNAVTQNLTTAASGNYTITVTDNRSCTATATAVVTAPSTIDVSLTPVGALCNGSNTGSINLNVVGGTAAYSYKWNNGSVNKNLTNVMANSYSVTVTDASMCTGSASTVITQPTAIIILPTSISPSCEGSPTGSINIIATGGIAAYTYKWSNGATTENLINIATNSYKVTVTDGNNCYSTATVVLTAPSSMTVNTTPTSGICSGSPTGSIDVSVSGGMPAYVYNWSNGATTQNLTNVASNSYTVTVTDAQSCTASATTALTAPTTITIDAVAIGTLCNGGTPTGMVNVTVSGGTPTYNYKWSNGPTTQNIINVPANTYKVTVTDAQSCTASATAVVTSPSAIAISSTKITPLCNGSSSGGINVNVAGGTPMYSYLWNNGATSQSLVYVTANTYKVTVTDAKGCTNSLTTVLTEPKVLKIDSIITVDVLQSGDNNGSATVYASGGTISYNYLWSNNATTQTANNLSNQNYLVTVTDINGCTVVGNATLLVITTDINNINGDKEVSLFPNPSMNHFQISGIETTATITISDLTGKLLLSKQITNNEDVSVSQFAKGIYNVAIITSKSIVNKRLVIE